MCYFLLRKGEQVANCPEVGYCALPLNRLEEDWGGWGAGGGGGGGCMILGKSERG